MTHISRPTISVVKPRQPRPTGFTLIELLVVISIISLLISILLPALSAAKEASRTSVCLNQLKQFGISFATYTNDSNDTYPPFDLSFFTTDPTQSKYFWNWGWMMHNRGYMPNVNAYRCPTAVPQMKYAYTNGASDITVNPNVATPYLYTAYGYSDYYIGSRYSQPGYTSRPTAVRRIPARNFEIKNPTSCMVMTETSYPAATSQGSYRLYSNGVVINDPHNGSGNVLWVDGHATLLSNVRTQLDGSVTSRANFYDWD